MSDVQDYKSSLSDPGSRKFETFSYLPTMEAVEIRKQVEYILSKGWNPAIEHTEPENAFGYYWYMWKLWPRPQRATGLIPTIMCALSALTTTLSPRVRKWLFTAGILFDRSEESSWTIKRAPGPIRRPGVFLK
jgi:hypothetical protein